MSLGEIYSCRRQRQNRRRFPAASARWWYRRRMRCPRIRPFVRDDHFAPSRHEAGVQEPSAEKAQCLRRYVELSQPGPGDDRAWLRSFRHLLSQAAADAVAATAFRGAGAIRQSLVFRHADHGASRFSLRDEAEFPRPRDRVSAIVHVQLLVRALCTFLGRGSGNPQLAGQDGERHARR